MGAISAFTTSALAYVPQPILGEDAATYISKRAPPSTTSAP